MQCSQRATQEPSPLQGLPEGLSRCVGVASDAHRGGKTKSVFLLPQSMTYRSFQAPSECILCVYLDSRVHLDGRFHRQFNPSNCPDQH